MNSMERVMNALQGQPVDRPPVLAVLGAYGGRLTGVPLPELYTCADKYAAGQRAVVDTFGIDMALAPFDYSVIAEAFGGDIRFFDDQPPNMKRPAAASVEQALNLPLPDPHTTGRLPMVLDATHRLAQHFRQTLPVFAALPGPAALPVLMLGMEDWLDTALFHPDAARKLLRHSARFWVQWAQALLDAGATALVITEGMAAATISPASCSKPPSSRTSTRVSANSAPCSFSTIPAAPSRTSPTCCPAPQSGRNLHQLTGQPGRRAPTYRPRSSNP